MKYKVEFDYVVKRYLYIEADSEEEAKEKLLDDENEIGSAQMHIVGIPKKSIVVKRAGVV